MKIEKNEKTKIINFIKEFILIKNEKFEDDTINEIERMRNEKIFIGSKIKRIENKYLQIDFISIEVEYYLDILSKRYDYLENKIDKFYERLDSIRYD